MKEAITSAAYVSDVRTSVAERLMAGPTRRLHNFDTASLPAASGAYVGKREDGLKAVPWGVEELLELGLVLHPWDGV